MKIQYKNYILEWVDFYWKIDFYPNGKGHFPIVYFWDKKLFKVIKKAYTYDND